MAKGDTGNIIAKHLDTLDQELDKVMAIRISRLKDGKIWLKKWLRFHKIKREYRKLARITKYFL